MFYTIVCIKIQDSLGTKAGVGSIIEIDGITLLLFDDCCVADCQAMETMTPIIAVMIIWLERQWSQESSCRL
jgi:hypothetical protein